MDIKRIEPAGPNTSLKEFLRTKNEALHLLCFKCGDVNQTMV